MPQSDFLITGGAAPEGSGLNVRLRIQAAFLAAISQSCGATEPTTPYPHMFWVDETSGLLKQRNVTNDAWITKWDITKGQLATLASPTFNGEVNLPSTTYIGGFPVARTAAPIFTGNSTFETLTAWSSVSLPASTTIGAVSATELSYLDGVTSSIQSQLNVLSSDKQAVLVSGTNIKTVNGNSLVGSGDVVITQNPSAVFSNSQTFTVSGTFTVPPGVTKIMVIGSHAGAGGGGGGYGATYGGKGGGGSASVYSAPKILTTNPGDSLSITIGAGGSGGAGAQASGAGGGGGSGGTTTIGGFNLNYYGSNAAGGGGSYVSVAGGTGGGGGGAGIIGGSGGGGGASNGAAGGSGSAGVYPLYSQASGGGSGVGIGGTSDCNNGTNGATSSGQKGGSGGSGGSGEVIIYW